MDLEILEEEIRQCDFCNLIKNTNNNTPLVFHGSGKIMAVVQPPNDTNIYEEQHFSTNEKRYFELILKAAGIDEEDIYVTSIAKCPYGSDNKENKKCTELCSTKFLLREMRVVKPKVILSVGKIPTSYFLSTPLYKTSMSEVIGKIYNYNDIPVMPIYTMSYLIQNGKKKTDEVIEQLTKVKDIKDTNGFCR